MNAMSSPSQLSRNALLLALGSCGALGGGLPVRDSSSGPTSPERPVPAVIEVLPPQEPAFGTALIELVAAGSPDELASIRVEYDVIGDEPDRGWMLARAVQDERTEPFGIAGVRLDPRGTNLAFFWDTDADLPGRAVSARLRVTAVGSSGESAPRTSTPFAIEND